MIRAGAEAPIYRPAGDPLYIAFAVFDEFGNLDWHASWDWWDYSGEVTRT